jgi:hypothetical protein
MRHSEIATVAKNLFLEVCNFDKMSPVDLDKVCQLSTDVIEFVICHFEVLFMDICDIDENSILSG